MNESNPTPLSRRQWLGRLPGAAAAVSLAAGYGTENLAAAEGGSASTNAAGAGTFNIRDFGAVGDGKALDTAALQAAIDACHRDGGGIVLVPAGTFLIGTVELKSNVTLRIAASGTLLGSADGSHYHGVDAIPLTGDATLGDGNWALIFAVDATNITVEGPGKIDGQGLQFHAPGPGQQPPSGIGGNQRPYHLLFFRCEHVRARDLRLVRCAYHSIRVIQSRFIWMDGLHIYNRVNNNNDGFHFISCEYLTVVGCTVIAQDDACALFGSCRFVTISNCTFSTRWSVFRFGGGEAENIVVSNCVLAQVYGCPIKFHGRPGDRFENISFSNLVLQDVTGPIHISIGSFHRRNPPPHNIGPGIARNISFSNIHGTVVSEPPPLPDYPHASPYRPGEMRSAIVVSAVGESIVENISFDNVHLTFGGGGSAGDAARREIPEVAGEYFMLGVIPAYGMYVRRAHGLTLNNVRFRVAAPDLRPALILEQVEDAAIHGLTVDGNPSAESVVRMTNAKQAYFAATRVLNSARVFLQVEGEGSEAITVDGGEQSRVDTPLVCAAGARQEAVRFLP